MLVGGRRPLEALVPAGHAAEGAPPLLRRALLDGRGRLDVLPRPRRARWCRAGPTGRRTGFVMHVKAFGLMTRHPVKLEQVPPDLREGLPVDARGRVDRPPREARARVFREFLERADAAARVGQARRHPLPDAAVRGLEAVVARLPRVGARPGRRRRVPLRAAPPLLVRRGHPGPSCCAGSRSGG